MAGAWAVALEGVYLSGGDDVQWTDILGNVACSGLASTAVSGVVGCFPNPPDGLLLPGQRTEDTTYAQRDGVKHFNDFYEPRIITIPDVMVCNTDCGCGTVGNARKKMRYLTNVWGRSCCDIEIVVYTDCNGQYDEGEPFLGPTTLVTNTLTNPSFETTASPWAVYAPGVQSITIDTAEFYAGTSSAKIDCTSTSGLDMGVDMPVAQWVSAVEDDVVWASAWFKASALGDRTARVELEFYDAADASLGIATFDTDLIIQANGWARVSVTDVAPADTAKVRMAAAWVGGASSGQTLGWIDAAMLTVGTEELFDYFDGDTPDFDDPVVGGQNIGYGWNGAANASTSLAVVSEYQENLDRSLYGPYGIVGKPRVASGGWIGQGSSCARVTLRFDGNDQRMYVLDECGTPGTQRCTTVHPGTQIGCMELPLCFPMCFELSTPSFTVPASTVAVLGTETVFPTLTLQGPLSQPRLENLDNGQFITYNGIVDVDDPVTINTENGTAFTESGVSKTHLLGGTIFLSLEPGNTDFRLWNSNEQSDGSVQICWRDTVKAA